MSTALHRYRDFVAEQPTCEDRWFCDALSAFRKGDEAAGKRISASCLRLAVQVVERVSPPGDESETLEMIEEANAAIQDALHSFSGDRTPEFLRHATAVIEDRLASFSPSA